MQGLITSSLFFSCALSLSLPAGTTTSQYNKRTHDQVDQPELSGKICELSSTSFSDSEIQETASRACHLLHQQRLFDACESCGGVKPELPRMFTGIISDEVGHNLHRLEHQKTHAHPGSNHVQYVNIDYRNDNDHESHNKHFEEHEAHNYVSHEHKRPEHESFGHESTVHIKSQHENPSHKESGFHNPHHQHESIEVIYQLPIHGQKVIHDSARMIEPTTSVLMTNTCIVVGLVEMNKNGNYNECKERPLSSLMPVNINNYSHHKTSCVQQVC